MAPPDTSTVVNVVPEPDSRYPTSYPVGVVPPAGAVQRTSIVPPAEPGRAVAAVTACTPVGDSPASTKLTTLCGPATAAVPLVSTDSVTVVSAATAPSFTTAVTVTDVSSASSPRLVAVPAPGSVSTLKMIVSDVLSSSVIVKSAVANANLSVAGHGSTAVWQAEPPTTIFSLPSTSRSC